MIDVIYFNDSFTNKARCLWKIQNFTNNLNGGFTSDVFPLNAPTFFGTYAPLKWTLHILPKLANGNHKDYVSIYLNLLSANAPELVVQCEFSILNANKVITNTHKLKNNYGKIQKYGCEKFIKREFLLKRENNLIVGNGLTITCDIEFAHTDSTSKLGQDFVKMLNNEKYCDVEFDVSGHKIRAHKIVLTARSDVFAAMFEHEMTEAKTNCVAISDIDHEIFKEMLHFIYTGEANNLNEVALDLLAAADKYDLKDLKGMCEEALQTNLSFEKAAETLILANLHSCQKLKEQTIDFINANAIHVIKTQGWQNMIQTHAHLVAEVFQAMVLQQANGAGILTPQTTPLFGSTQPPGFGSTQHTLFGVQQHTLFDLYDN